MKKFSYILLGFIVGIVFTASAGTYAASIGLIGKKITAEVPIVLNGEKLSEVGSVAEGTTLLPVRSLAGVFEAEVEFKNGTVYLNKNEGSGANVSQEGWIDSPVINVQFTGQSVEELEAGIKSLEATISESEYLLSQPNTLSDADKVKVQQALEKYKQQKADLEAKLQALQNQ
jgi:hypothetical protein